MGTDTQRKRRGDYWLALTGIVLLAANLRPAAATLGPLLPQVRNELNLPTTIVSMLAALPALCFAAAGLLHRLPGLRGRSDRRQMAIAAALLGVSLLARAAASTAWQFVIATLGALCGIALSNVALPGLIKRYFPQRIGLATGLSVMTMFLGMTIAAGTAVPLSDVLGDWRLAIGAWGVLALLGVLPWLALSDPASTSTAAAKPEAVPPGRRPYTWAMAGFFGAQSTVAFVMMAWLPQRYIDAGLNTTAGGSLLALVTVIGIPVAFLTPIWVTRTANPRTPMLVISVATVFGLVGLLAAPTQMPWLWAVFIGVGTGSFPLAMTLIGIHAETPEKTAALSRFSQSVGFALAAAAALMFGLLHGATNGWLAPLAMLLTVVAFQIASGWWVAAPANQSHGTRFGLRNRVLSAGAPSERALPRTTILRPSRGAATGHDDYSASRPSVTGSRFRVSKTQRAESNTA